MAVEERVKYKVGKTTAYWRGATRESLVSFVRHELRKIAQRLDEVIVGVVDLLDVEKPERPSALKPVEDTIDAIICAWVGTTILDDNAEPFGDSDFTIWVPKETWAIVH
jgi:hypothetical protein